MTGLPYRMTAIVVETTGGPDVLQPKSVPTPKPAHGDVLIRVAAAGLNRADLSQRSGTYGARSSTPKPPGVLGLEVSGVVAAVGEGVTGWRIGDAVCALINGGGYAEFAVAPGPNVFPCRRALHSWMQAACRKPASRYGSTYSISVGCSLENGCSSMAAPVGSARSRSRWRARWAHP